MHHVRTHERSRPSWSQLLLVAIVGVGPGCLLDGSPILAGDLEASDGEAEGIPDAGPDGDGDTPGDTDGDRSVDGEADECRTRRRSRRRDAWTGTRSRIAGTAAACAWSRLILRRSTRAWSRPTAGVCLVGPAVQPVRCVLAALLGDGLRFQHVGETAARGRGDMGSPVEMGDVHRFDFRMVGSPSRSRY